MKKIFFLPVIVVLIVFLSFSTNDATATSYVYLNQSTCTQMFGSWSGNTCTVSTNRGIPTGITLMILPGQTLEMSPGSSLSVSGTITVYSGGILDNHGIIQIYGSGIITNLYSKSWLSLGPGTIDNYNILSNFGAINNYGVLSNSGSITGNGKFYSALTSITNTGSIKDSVTIPSTTTSSYLVLNFPITVPSGTTLTIPSPPVCGQTVVTINRVPHSVFLPCGFTMNAGSTISNYGNVISQVQMTINSGGSIVNYNGGYIWENSTISNSGTVTNYGIIGNYPVGLVVGSNAITYPIFGINNLGSIFNHHGGIIYGNINNMNVSTTSSTHSTSYAGTVTNSGNLVLFEGNNGVSITNTGVINIGCGASGHSVPSSSTISYLAANCSGPQQPGYVQVPGSFYDAAYIYNSGGTININYGSTIYIGLVNNSGIINNDGTIAEYCYYQLNGNQPTGPGITKNICQSYP